MNAEDIMALSNDDARLSIEISRRCNSCCIHCFAGAGEKQQTEIDFEVLRRIILEGAEAGYNHLHITGGEPLLYHKLFDALDHAIAAGYKTILLNTNGILLDEKKCRRLAEYPELTITISLEGSEALHDRFRGNGSFRKTTKGLTISLGWGLNIIIFTVACKSVLPALPQFAEKLFSDFLGIKYLTLSRLQRSTSGHHFLRNEFLSPEDFLNVVRTISLLNLYGWPTVLLDDPLINVVGKMLKMPAIPESKALHCRGNLMVFADLTIGLSHLSRGLDIQYAPGSIKAVISSEEYEKVVAANQNVCGSCTHALFCHENGLLRPTEKSPNGQANSYFCQDVLNGVSI